MKILALHSRNTFNAGDLSSCPLEYFDFPGHEIIKADMSDPPDVKPDMVIYGGGSIIASPDYRPWGNAMIVAWGVGHNERRKPWRDKMIAAHRNGARIATRYFPRDPGMPWPLVPCASCMHPIFDEKFPPMTGIVRYSAARRITVDDPPDTPHMTNEESTIEDAVRFLARSSRVVTSSYHGAYWAGLLGKKVRTVPWGSKFEYLPNLSLEECRAANRRAYAEVLKLIEAHG